MRIRLLILFALYFFVSGIYAQQDGGDILRDEESAITSDTVSPIREQAHSPKKAAWMSAVFPGLGQIYNKKYWKLPIIYGGFVGTSYGINFNYVYFKQYRTEYRYRLDNDGEKKKFLGLGIENVNAERQIYQRNMEIFILLTAVWYLANILDAAVDAHLMTFDISDDLSMNIVPCVGMGSLGMSSYTTKLPPVAGFSFIFNFK